MRRLLLLRPEPGLSGSAERARAIGLEVIACPLFEVEPVAWDAPDPAQYDAMLLTSANSMRHGGAALGQLTSLPVHAVGETTAQAARDAGFGIASVGDRDLAHLLTLVEGDRRLLHLAGQDHRDVQDPRVDRRIVYRSTAIADPQLPPVEGLIAAIHSPRAGSRFGELVLHRGKTVIAAISAAAADSCGSGWERIEVAAEPNEKSLLALAARLCHTSSPQ